MFFSHLDRAVAAATAERGCRGRRPTAVRVWTVTEFHSALSVKVRTRTLGAGHRAAALSAFTRLSAESFQVLPVAREDFVAAARYADYPDLNLRAGDALHLAICANHGARLCTLDRRLGEAGPRLGVESFLLSARGR